MNKLFIGLFILLCFCGCSLSIKTEQTTTPLTSSGPVLLPYPKVKKNPDWKALGKLDGLGSPDFVLSDRTFSFPKELEVRVRFQKQSYNDGTKIVTTAPTTWNKLDEPIQMAYDPNIGRMGMNVSAIKIGDRWFTMYGGTELFTKQNSEQFSYFACPDEQDCIEFRVDPKNGKKFKTQFTELNKAWYEVGLEGVPLDKRKQAEKE